ncbi:MAG: hypothetical protein PUB49_11725 [Selenomonadaceae bacterium]|nr:hypothetical protein [Selenomonadaceae bacterium]
MMNKQETIAYLIQRLLAQVFAIVVGVVVVVAVSSGEVSKVSQSLAEGAMSQNESVQP